jgi:hypothetical protein
MTGQLSEDIIKIFQSKTSCEVQTIRNKVSTFKIKECPHATQNAAAHVLALTMGFSCAQKLKQNDKISLPENLSDIVAKYKLKKPVEQSPDLSKSVDRKAKVSSDPLEREAWKNARAYPRYYTLENTLRFLILNRMGNDVSWWTRPSVPDKIVEYAKRIEDDEKEIPWRTLRQNVHPIYYVTLTHLAKIIHVNWPKFDKLGEQNTFLTRLRDLVPIRNSIAHHIPISLRDSQEVNISIDKILQIIKNKYPT